MSALKLLPFGEAKKVARIDGCEGTPVPERWYILVNDPKDENGLREYVIAGGELVASRHISQFAEFIRPADVFGSEPLRVDSDRAMEIARQYADASGATIASMNFEIKKDSTRNCSLWDVTGLDEAGKVLGHVCLQARNGEVVSHEGFAEAPPALVVAKAAPPAAHEVATSSTHPEHTEHRDSPLRPVHVKTREQSIPEPAHNPDFFLRLGGTIQKIFQR